MPANEGTAKPKVVVKATGKRKAPAAADGTGGKAAGGGGMDTKRSRPSRGTSHGLQAARTAELHATGGKSFKGGKLSASSRSLPACVFPNKSSGYYGVFPKAGQWKVEVQEKAFARRGCPGISICRVFEPQNEEGAKNAALYYDRRMRQINDDLSPEQKILPLKFPLNFPHNTNPTPAPESGLRSDSGPKWEVMLAKVVEFKAEHGHCKVGARYVNSSTVFKDF